MANSTGKNRKSCLGAAWRLLLRAVIALVLLVSGLTAWQAWSSADESRRFPPAGQFYDIDGIRYHLQCAGIGGPTILLESGLGGPAIWWGRVQPELAQSARVCSYDRAGLGWSSTSPGPRTAQNIASELHALLGTAKIPGPYILVGHSFGGYIARIFAKEYRAEVAGMVLIGAGHEDFNRRMPPGCEALAQSNASFGQFAYPLTFLGITRLAGNLGLLAPLVGDLFDQASPDLRAELLAQTLYRPQYWQTYVAEMTALSQSEAEVRATGTLGDLPLIVVSGNPDVSRVPPSCPATSVVALSRELQVELAHLSSRGEQIACDSCGHYIPLTDPGLVIEAVRKLHNKFQ